LGNQPVEILVEDVYLLVVPSPQVDADPQEEEERAQAAKATLLESEEETYARSQTNTSTGKDRHHPRPNASNLRHPDEAAQSQGLWASLTAKIINNLQVTVKNIHVRYEDELSVPGVSRKVHDQVERSLILTS
jgi:vacuolar protein sorting-associated protein 13A/C